MGHRETSHGHDDQRGIRPAVWLFVSGALFLSLLPMQRTCQPTQPSSLERASEHVSDQSSNAVRPFRTRLTPHADVTSYDGITFTAYDEAAQFSVIDQMTDDPRTWFDHGNLQDF